MLAHSFDRFYVEKKLFYFLLNIENFLNSVMIINVHIYKRIMDILQKLGNTFWILFHIAEKLDLIYIIINNRLNLIMTQQFTFWKMKYLILPWFPTSQRQGIIIALVTGFIGLAYEGISSFLHNRRHNVLHRAVKGMDSKTTIHHNKLMPLEDSMVMYGIYNAETLEKLTDTVHCMNNFTSPNEKLFWG